MAVLRVLFIHLFKLYTYIYLCIYIYMIEAFVCDCEENGGISIKVFIIISSSVLYYYHGYLERFCRSVIAFGTSVTNFLLVTHVNS